MGLEKLATTESSVADMQQELIALQPQLEVSTKETEAAMVVCDAVLICLCILDFAFVQNLLAILRGPV